MSRSKILIFAPGAGLGHLVRCSGIAMKLQEQDLDVTVATNSAFSEGMARLCAVPMIRIKARTWANDSLRLTDELNPDLVVLDTFPAGLRGEWRHDACQGRRFIHLARRLNVAAYCEAVSLQANDAIPGVATTVTLEPISALQLEWLSNRNARVQTLTGLVRFPHEQLDVPVPDQLAADLAKGDLALVVHSGPREEVSALLQIAEDLVRQGRGCRIAAIAPHVDNSAVNAYDFFPAATLFDQATAIITAAGYNAVAEAATDPSRHHLVPFERRYDLQQERYSEFESVAPSKTNALSELVNHLCLALRRHPLSTPFDG